MEIIVAGRDGSKAQDLVSRLNTEGVGFVRTSGGSAYAREGDTWRAPPLTDVPVADVKSLGPPHFPTRHVSLSTAVLDASDPASSLSSQIRDLAGKGGLVVNASGPYRESDGGYHLATACATEGVHYWDLADSRPFVANFTQSVTDAAGDHYVPGTMVRTSGSTVTALSTAMADEVLARAPEGYILQSVDAFIGVGHQGPRGLGTIRSVLEYAGHDVPVLENGVKNGGSKVGWGELSWKSFHGLAAPRLVAPVSTPDNDIFPERYPGLQSHVFGASLELPLVMYGVYALSWARRVFGISSLDRVAPFLQMGANMLNVFGSPDGGMLMKGNLVSTSDPTDTIPYEVSMIGQASFGPDTPVVSAELVVADLVAAAAGGNPGVLSPHMQGIGTAAGMFPLSRFRQALDGAGYPFSWRIDVGTPVLTDQDEADYTGSRHAFSKAMGEEEMVNLPESMRVFHDEGGRVTGALEVKRNKAFLNNLVTTLGMLPKDSNGIKVKVDVTSKDGRWDRVFYSGPPEDPGPIASRLSSVWSLSKRSRNEGASGVVLESFYLGSMRMGFHISPIGDKGSAGFRHMTKGMFVMWLPFPIPFPFMLRGDGYSLAHADGKGWYVKVDISAPLIGNLVTYEGDVFIVDPAPNTAPNQAANTAANTADTDDDE